jgi:hypothetical protein
VPVLQRTRKPKRLVLKPSDRFLWVWLSRLWSGWRSALIIVKPETVVGWHRQVFSRMSPYSLAARGRRGNSGSDG